MSNRSRNCNLCVRNTSKRSNRAIEGIRTLLTLVVMLHHLDILNPKLLEQNILWSNNKRNLLNNDELINIWHLLPGKSLSPLGLFINIFNGYLSMTIFTILSGYILSFEFFEIYTQSKSYEKSSCYLIKLSIKRNLRFIFPLLTIQVLTYLMYYFEFILPEKSANDTNEYISPYATETFYSIYYLRITFLFFWHTNGALWIMCYLFY
eukprot:213484_1